MSHIAGGLEKKGKTKQALTFKQPVASPRKLDIFAFGCFFDHRAVHHHP
jgi:hypothetical protein